LPGYATKQAIAPEHKALKYREKQRRQAQPCATRQMRRRYAPRKQSLTSKIAQSQAQNGIAY